MKGKNYLLVGAGDGAFWIRDLGFSLSTGMTGQAWDDSCSETLRIVTLENRGEVELDWRFKRHL